MTTDEAPSVQSEALSSEQVEAIEKKVEAVEQQVAALAAAQSTARKLRLVLPIGFLIFVCVFLYLFVGLKDEFADEENLNEMTDIAQKQLEDNILPQLQRQVETLVKTAQPALTDAFTEQVEKDKPRYTKAITEQGDLLFKNLEQGLEEQVNAHYKSFFEKHEAVLKEEYPNLSDEQLAQLADNIEKAGQELVQKYYVAQMQGQLERMMTSINDFPVADPVDSAKEGVEPLGQELIGCFMEIAKERLTNPQDTLFGAVDKTN